MLSSKLKFILSLGLMSSGLVACTLPSPQTRDGNSTNSASYFVDSTEVKFSQERYIKGFSIPEARSFHFKICIKDRKQAKAILNHDFYISGDNTTKVTKTTDGSGCLNWDEELIYNHFADAQFVTVERTLEAHGLHQGERVLHFAINPWENQAYDLEKTDVKNLVPVEKTKETLQSTNSARKSIVASDLQVSVLEKQTTEKGLRFNMEVRGQPSVETRKSSQEITNTLFTEGIFKAKIRIFHTAIENNKEVHTQMAASETMQVSTQKGQLYINFPFELTKLCTRGQYQIGLELEADLPASYQLKKFEGLYFLSECDQIKGNFFSRLQEPPAGENAAPLSLEAYATSTTLTAQNSASADASGYQKSSYVFTELKPTVVNSKESTGIQRKTTLQFSTCISSPLDKKTIVGYQFEITKLNGSKESVTTNSFGCLYWDEVLDLNLLQQECEKQTSLTITQKDLNIREQISLLINPWNGSVRDLNYNKGLLSHPAQCAQGGTQVFMDSLSFKKSSDYAYEVDSFLNLKINMPGTLSLRFQIQRPSLTEESGLAREDAPIGDYKLQIALLKNEANPLRVQMSDVLMVSEQTVHLESKGVISHPITLTADNLKEISNTNQFLIAVSPVNVPANFANSVYRGNLIPMNTSDNTPLEKLSTATNTNLFATLLQVKAAQEQSLQQSQQSQGHKETLRREFLLSTMNLDRPEETLELRKSLAAPYRFVYPEYYTQEKAKQVLDVGFLTQLVQTEKMSPDLAKRFCFYWFYDYLQRPWKRTGEASVIKDPRALSFPLMRCQEMVKKDPRSFFDIQVRSFVQNPKVTEARDGILRDLTISSAFSFGKSQGHSETQSFSVDRGASASWRVFDFIGVSAGVRWSTSSADTTADQVGHQISFSNQVAATVETVSLRIKAETSEKCLIIKVKPEVFLDPTKANFDSRYLLNPHLTPAEKVSVMRGGLLLCEGSPQKHPYEFVENYYILNQNTKGGIALNPNSSKNRPFYAAIRGDSDFVSFLSLMQKDFKLPDNFEADYRNQEFLMDRSGAFFLKNLPGSPGQYIHTR